MTSAGPVALMRNRRSSAAPVDLAPALLGRHPVAVEQPVAIRMRSNGARPASAAAAAAIEASSAQVDRRVGAPRQAHHLGPARVERRRPARCRSRRWRQSRLPWSCRVLACSRRRCTSGFASLRQALLEAAPTQRRIGFTPVPFHLAERWQSGRMYRTRNAACRQRVPWVRIPPSPPQTLHTSLQTGSPRITRIPAQYALRILASGKRRHVGRLAGPKPFAVSGHPMGGTLRGLTLHNRENFNKIAVGTGRSGQV